MKTIAGLLLLLVVALASSPVSAFDWRNADDPVYDLVQIEWSKSEQEEGGGRWWWELDVVIPDEIDCRAKCHDIDMCGLGVCMLNCFDRDHDGSISAHEMQRAIDKQLHWYERALTADGQGWVDKFDGKDGTTERNGSIEFKEVIVADVPCSEFQKAQDYLCSRCQL